MNQNLIIIGLLFFLLLPAGCTNTHPTEKNTAKTTTDTIAAARPDWNMLVNEWNEAQNAQNTSLLSGLYADSVHYYGQWLGKNACIGDKREFFTCNPDYRQEITGTIQTEKLSENRMKCSFHKKVTMKGKVTDYPAYLIFSEKNGSWLVATESDAVTDKLLTARKNLIIPRNAVKGDFNGDGLPEFAWIIGPQLNREGDDCADGNCVSHIYFSEKGMEPIAVKQSIGGMLMNVGDLDGDGRDELGLHPEWFTSCWSVFYTWTFKEGRWQNAVTPFPTHCQQWEEGVVPVLPDKHKKGYVLIHYSKFENDDIRTLTRVEKVN